MAYPPKMYRIKSIAEIYDGASKKVKTDIQAVRDKLQEKVQAFSDLSDSA